MSRKVIVLMDEDAWKALSRRTREDLIRLSGVLAVGEKGVWRIEKAANANHPDHVTRSDMARIVGETEPGD